MGVYIKGMEMPTSCSMCLLSKLSPTGESLICNYTLSTVPWDERPFDCPLVPVPPHGRLIDAEALHEELYALEYARENEWLDGVREARGVDAARVALLDAPTIIPAAVGEYHAYTNADRIRAMTDEELAEWLDNVCKSAFDEGYTKATDEPLMSPYPSIASEWLAWLKQEGE